MTLRPPATSLPSRALLLLTTALVVGACGDETPQQPAENIPDGESPVLVSAALAPARVFASPAAPGRLDAEIQARDSSEVREVVVSLGQEQGPSRECRADLVEGTATEGTWHCQFSLAETTPVGAWRGTVVLTDGVGNRGEHEIPGSIEVVADPDDDLSIRYIQRLPEMDYVWESLNPAREGWPVPGQQVQWAAHVFNSSVRPREAVAYRWLEDGTVIADGTVHVPALGEVVVELPWDWTFQRHRLRLEVDPDGAVDELSDVNNDLEIFTDALSIGFYAERSLWEHFLRHQRDLGVGAVTFEDWAHRHVARFNELLRDAVYPETPTGVLDRVRLDRVTVVDDGALPLSPLDTIDQVDRGPTLMPNIEDRTVDMEWGFTAATLEYLYQDTRSTDHNEFFFQGSLIHELGHARYLTDVYGFDVYQGLQGGSVEITEGGELVAGSRFMPGEEITFNGQPGRILHHAEEQGLMNTDFTRVDRYSAVALNLIAGHRAVTGNFNTPRNVGVYLQDLPQQNIVTLVDGQGNPLAGAELRVYQAVGAPGYWYAKRFDDVPDLVLTADAAGQVDLPRNPFGGGTIQHDWEVSNAVAILRVEHQGRVGYQFLEVSRFNLEYWRGNTAVAEYTVRVELLEP